MIPSAFNVGVFDQQQWINNHPDKTGSACDLYINDLSTTTEKVENNIKSGAIQQAGNPDCGNHNMCYELIK